MEASRLRNRSKSLGTSSSGGPIEVTPVPVISVPVIPAPLIPVGSNIIQKIIKLPREFFPRQLTRKRIRKIMEFAEKSSLGRYGSRRWIVALIAHLGEPRNSVRINDVRCWLKKEKFQKCFGMDDMIYSPSASTEYGVEIVGVQVGRRVQERCDSSSANNTATPIRTRKCLELQRLLQDVTFVRTNRSDLSVRVTRARARNEQAEILSREPGTQGSCRLRSQ